jgi:hypothetical protein
MFHLHGNVVNCAQDKINIIVPSTFSTRIRPMWPKVPCVVLVSLSHTGILSNEFMIEVHKNNRNLDYVGSISRICKDTLFYIYTLSIYWERYSTRCATLAGTVDESTFLVFHVPDNCICNANSRRFPCPSYRRFPRFPKVIHSISQWLDYPQDPHV